MNRTNLIILILFTLALIGAYSIYKPFLLSMVVAMLLTMATYNLTKKVTKKFQSRKIGSLIMTLSMSLIIFAPIIYIATVGVSSLTNVDMGMIKDMVHSVEKFIINIPYVGDEVKGFFSEEKILSSVQSSAHYLASLGTAGLDFVKNMLLVMVFYFIINLYGDKLFELIRKLMPVSRIKSTRMIQEVSSTMEVVFYSIIATAALEGILFGVLVTNYGFDGLLFGIIYGFSSLIPIVGGALVWVPVTIYAWNEISEKSAWIIAMYSIFVIAVIADTIIKPFIIKIIKEDLLKSSIQINELVIFFSILAGIGSYGVWGMILGPAITSFFIAMTKVYIEFNKGHL